MNATSFPPEYVWPSLGEPYGSALHAAVADTIARTDPAGIIAAGSVVQGQTSPASDLDLIVIHHRPERHFVQKTFDGVPAEIAITSASLVEREFTFERQSGAPFSAHMLATGFVVYDADGTVERLQSRAREVLAAGPDPSPLTLLQMRFGAVTMLEDALDVTTRDPDMCRALLIRAVEEAVRYQFASRHQWQPRPKYVFETLAEINPPLARKVRRFYRSGTLEEHGALAQEILTDSVGATSFFEWEAVLPETDNQ